MFLQNKYNTWYYSIINRRTIKPEGYSERHHIIPKSLGGSNDQSNLVYLTAREHFLVHWLLTKMCEGENKKKMYFAMYSLSWTRKNVDRIVSSWQYEAAKKAKSKGMQGSHNPIHLRDTTGKGNPFFGRTHSQETLDKISKTQKKRMANQVHHFKGTEGPIKGRKWFHCPVTFKNAVAFECPEGYVRGKAQSSTITQDPNI